MPEHAPCAQHYSTIHKVFGHPGFRLAPRHGRMGWFDEVLIEEWDKITIEEINAEIAKLPSIMQRCLAVNGGKKYHA